MRSAALALDEDDDKEEGHEHEGHVASLFVELLLGRESLPEDGRRRTAGAGMDEREMMPLKKPMRLAAASSAFEMAWKITSVGGVMAQGLRVSSGN